MSNKGKTIRIAAIVLAVSALLCFSAAAGDLSIHDGFEGVITDPSLVGDTGSVAEFLSGLFAQIIGFLQKAVAFIAGIFGLSL